MQAIRGFSGGGVNSFKGVKSGFTLAEVLITLGIIGVVVAMTLPSLINNKRNKELETAFKKNYSAISQALNMYYAQNGERLTQETCGFRQLKPILIRYMSVLHDCGFGSDVDKACVPHYNEPGMTSNVYKNFNGTNPINLIDFEDGQFVLNDGSLILIKNKGDLLWISVDVNGYLKNPNKLGHDLFIFQIDNKGNLLPMGAKGTYYYNVNDGFCSQSSTYNNNGAGCTIKAVNEKDYFTKLH